MNTSHLLKIDSRKFLWTQRVGIADVTDLIGRQSLHGTLFRQIYQDAADAGFVVVSGRTGNEIVFTYQKDLLDRSNQEKIGWRFVSIDDNRGSVGKYTVDISND